jgi:hypothetical protein
MLHQIEDGENEDPDEVDEVPEETSDFDAIGEPFGVGIKHFATEEEIISEDQGTADDVETVETGDGEIDGVVGVPCGCEFGGEADLLAGNG